MNGEKDQTVTFAQRIPRQQYLTQTAQPTGSGPLNYDVPLDALPLSCRSAVE
jgi:hypothetical protein